MTAAFAINSPHVVHETIDGETILIHLGTGTYYSLDGVGAELWGALIAGVPADEAATALAAGWGIERALAAESVEELAQELLAEGLLVPGPPVPGDAARGELSRPAAGAAFAAPVLRKYTDMQDFMLVDPIHDVDEQAGWPHVKAG